MFRKLFVLAILIMLNLSAIYGLDAYLHRNDVIKSADTAEKTPDFTWRDFDGKTHNIAELKGHIVVIHFWATWCAPCRKEFPELLAAAKALGDNVIFLTISGDDELAPAKKFVENAEQKSGTKNLANVLYALDDNKHIAIDIFQTAVYPESIVLDANQNMRRKFGGAIEWQDANVMDYLKQLK